MKYITLTLITLLSLVINAQTFPVGKKTLNFKDASRTGGSAGGATILVPTGGTGRSVGADLFYPATTAGGSIAAIGQFPIVVFGHGFVMAASDYTNVANRLASLGYIVAVARTENEGPLPFPTPNHVQFGADLAYLAGAVYALNSTTITSLTSFNNKVLNKSAIGGHSMGAGCSFLAAASNASLTCLFNFAAATTNNTPNSIASASLVTVPTLLISGELDTVADSTVQNSHYNNTASAIKFHTIIKGVTHCDIGNGTSGTCTIGQGACSGGGCNAVLFTKYMAYLEPFLANQLKSDCAAGNTFMTLIQNPSTDRVGRKIKGTIASSITLNVTGAATVCAGSQSTLTASGAATYTWTGNVVNGVAFTPTLTQTYSVSASNTGGCIQTATANITVNSAPLVTAIATNSVICNGSSTTLNGGGALTYTWSSNVNNGVAFTPTSTSTYTVVGTDLNGCKNSALKVITVNNAPTVTASATNSIICNGSSTTLNGGGAVTYTWSSNVNNGVAFTPTSTANYTVVGTDANGCKNSAVQIITVNNAPTVTGSATNSVICNGASTTLNGGGAATYTWSSNVNNGVAFTPTATANYTVIGTDANGCKNSAVQVITVNNAPTVTASATNSVICNGASTTLNGGGAATYTWSSNVNNGVAFTPTATANYTVIGTDANGCKNSAIKLITVNNAPTVTASATNSVICNGSSTTLNGGGAATYTWSSNVNNGVAFTPTATANYTVVGTDANGCKNSAIKLITVNNGPTVTASATNSVICNGSSTTLNGDGALTYTWSSNVNNGIAFTPNASANYTVIGSDVNGCKNSAVQVITVNNLPTLLASTNNTLLCSGQSATLTVSGANTFTWSTNETTPSIVVNPTAPTTYTVIGKDLNNCSNTTSITQNVSVCTSVTEFQESISEITIFPNPTNDKINVVYQITNNDIVNFSLTDVAGRLIFIDSQIPNSNKQTKVLDVKNLESGVYIFSIKQNSFNKSFKIIKQ